MPEFTNKQDFLMRVCLQLFLVSVLVLWQLTPAVSQPLQLVRAFPNLAFTQPVYLTHSNDGTNRIFVIQKNGLIKVFPNDSTVAVADTFMNLASRIVTGSGGDERGLLGIAFHPNYANNGYFYVNYTQAGNGRTILARYKVNPLNPNKGDFNSELKLFEVYDPYSNHNGGTLFFGMDGYLYAGWGDGGSAGDPGNRAQNLDSLLGKILRVNVDTTVGSQNYGIPPTNPFVAGGGRPEIFAWGMRNPWRFSQDPVTGLIWCGDVGQGLYEEVDLIENGKNYGWKVTEGLHCYSPSVGCSMTGQTLPIKEYGHSGGRCSITGGFVYRGSRRPELAGRYIYADYCTGELWKLRYEGGTVTEDASLLSAVTSVLSFGTDQNNELYVLGNNGFIYWFNSISIPSTLSVIAPNGNETWQTGSAQTIQWNSSNLSGNVKVELSRNGGSGYATLFASIANDGTEPWTVTGPLTSNALIRVSSVSNPTVLDVSNAPFTISPNFALLTKLFLRDNGGEKDSLEYGTASGSTDGIDLAYGEYELPPLPPAGVFDFRWFISGTQGTRRDVRDTLGGSRQQIIYTGKLQPGGGGYPFVMKWNRTELPAGTFTLRDGPSGFFFSVNMKQQDSLVISDEAVQQFQLVYDAGNTVYSSVQSGWSILSVPVTVGNLARGSVFPSSTSNAFAFTPTGYVSRDTLSYGVGYWLKFSSNQTLSISGDLIAQDTIDVLQGWNIIGSISTPVPISSIIQIPSGIVASQYFGYSLAGYSSATSIDPMRGYWVKVSQNGMLVLPQGSLRPSGKQK